MIKSASYSPAKIHVNDTVLIHYKLDSIFLPGEDADTEVLPPYLAKNGGELIPLFDPPYTVGGALPSFAEAKAAVHGAVNPNNVWGGYRGSDDYYALFKAPDTPGFVTIEFFLGSSDTFYAPKAKHRMTLTILP
jgi:hypothetical protein